jgi:hypothetical protein
MMRTFASSLNALKIVNPTQDRFHTKIYPHRLRFGKLPGGFCVTYNRASLENIRRGGANVRTDEGVVYDSVDHSVGREGEVS